MDQVRLKLHEAVECYVDKDRSGLIPAGEIVEPTSIAVGDKVRVHWGGSREGMGFVMVNQSKLESSADPV